MLTTHVNQPATCTGTVDDPPKPQALTDAVRARSRGHVGARPRRAAARRSRELIARLTKFQAFAVYLLDPQAQRALDRLLGRLSRRRRRADAAREGRARAWSAPPSPKDSRFSSTTSTPIRDTSKPCRARTPELVVPLRRKGRVIGALNLLSDTAGPVHRERRSAAAPVRRARRRRDRERAALRARARVYEHARDAVGDRARVRRDPQPRRAADAHRQPHQTRHRLPHVRHPARQRRDAASSR
mgnify:CR=1 FL=1